MNFYLGQHCFDYFISTVPVYLVTQRVQKIELVTVLTKLTYAQYGVIVLERLSFNVNYSLGEITCEVPRYPETHEKLQR